MSRHLQVLILLLALTTLFGCGAPEDEIVLLDPEDVEAQPAESDSIGFEARMDTGTRSGLRLVGSSTVFPFTTAVAESFGAKTEFPTPVVEATGTGGGMNLFCSGLGSATPDMSGASRRIRDSEVELCQRNGVSEIVEIPIGFDGIVLGNSIDAAPADMNKQDIFLALAFEIPMPVNAQGVALFGSDGGLLSGASFADVADFDCNFFIPNPFERWSDIDPLLPAHRIEVYGPPPTSGTRDAFLELGMQAGATHIGCLADSAERNERQFEQLASRIREDGAWIDSGENDNTIIQTLASSPNAFGLFGYSFLEQNADRIQATLVDGVEPSYENIANGRYPVSRSMFVYVKVQHAGVIPGLVGFIEELTSEDAWGPFGYLADRGLIALPDTRRSQVAVSATNLETIELE